ncbi:MAG TPA: hypothetical protein VHM90_01415, partial [Phycisphaerae bacterium]|nr:hypothetical protein [Phycisphaerae bacterium]
MRQYVAIILFTAFLFPGCVSWRVQEDWHDHGSQNGPWIAPGMHAHWQERRLIGTLAPFGAQSTRS